MNEEEVQANEYSAPTESGNETYTEPVPAAEEVTYSVVVSNFEEIVPYYDLQIALDCMILGLLLTLIIALVWVKHL